MFILIPLLIIFCSALSIAIIIWRKKSYINKLHSLNTAGGAEELSGNFPDISVPASFSWLAYGGDLFPEIKALIEKIRWHEYKTMWLREAEKILRKTRLVSLRVDNFSDSLIKKIRKVHVNGQLQEKAVSERADEAMGEAGKDTELKTMSPAFLRNEEQRLVMEIAKNPKNSELYESLGDLYVEMNNFTDAKESYEAAIELSPQKESLTIKLSEALKKLSS